MPDTATPRRRWIEFGAVAAVGLVAIALVVPAVQKARESARRTQSKNNLHSIGLALHNYHETYERFPPGGTFRADGRGQHGWITITLPFIDASPLYNWIEFRQPWDAPRNAGYLRRSIPIMRNPSVAHDTWTAEFAPADYSANSHLLAANSSVAMREFEDLANTFLIGELGGDFVPWGCPYNWRPLTTLNATPRTYGRPEVGGQLLMVDGSVRWISPDVSTDVLETLRGPDLAGAAAPGIAIHRPASFPYPADVLEPASVGFGDGVYYSGMRNNRGELVRLWLSWSKLSEHEPADEDLLRLTAFAHLRSLEVSGKITDDGLRTISGLSQLTELAIDSDRITDDGILQLAALGSLTKLSVRGKKVTPEGLAGLQERMSDCDVSNKHR